ncbi:hypothetical protein C8R45DRAFT_945979 [Mycena sanguinolenta]|nr:hypothetical protein C8R45DRAFT_945979 [Mycena sanguinolenta]
MERRRSTATPQGSVSWRRGARPGRVRRDEVEDAEVGERYRRGREWGGREPASRRRMEGSKPRRYPATSHRASPTQALHERHQGGCAHELLRAAVGGGGVDEGAGLEIGVENIDEEQLDVHERVRTGEVGEKVEDEQVDCGDAEKDRGRRDSSEDEVEDYAGITDMPRGDGVDGVSRRRWKVDEGGAAAVVHTATPRTKASSDGDSGRRRRLLDRRRCCARMSRSMTPRIGCIPARFRKKAIVYPSMLVRLNSRAQRSSDSSAGVGRRVSIGEETIMKLGIEIASCRSCAPPGSGIERREGAANGAQWGARRRAQCRERLIR